jgi:hypothetical protein
MIEPIHLVCDQPLPEYSIRSSVQNASDDPCKEVAKEHAPHDCAQFEYRGVGRADVLLVIDTTVGKIQTVHLRLLVRLQRYDRPDSSVKERGFGNGGAGGHCEDDHRPRCLDAFGAGGGPETTGGVASSKILVMAV